MKLAFLMHIRNRSWVKQFLFNWLGGGYCFLKITKSAGWLILVGRADCAGALGGDPPPLPYGKSWRIEPKPKVHISDHILQISDPLKISPSAPAHSARPPQIDRGPGFYDFQETLATAERAEKNLSPTALDANLHRKCKLQDASFMILML